LVQTEDNRRILIGVDAVLAVTRRGNGNAAESSSADGRGAPENRTEADDRDRSSGGRTGGNESKQRAPRRQQ